MNPGEHEPLFCPSGLLFWESEWRYLDNTKHFIFWLCNMEQLNFRHFNTNSKIFSETVIFFPQRRKNGSKKANIILFSISRSFRPFYDNSGLFQEISEDYQRFPKTVEQPSKQLTVRIFFENSKHKKIGLCNSKHLNIMGK